MAKNPNLFVITDDRAIDIIKGGEWLYREQTIHGAGADGSGVYLALLADTILLKGNRFQFRIEQRGRDVGTDTGVRILIEEPYNTQEQVAGSRDKVAVERWRAVATLYNAEKLQAKREELALIEQRWQAEQQRRNEQNARRDAERERIRTEREAARAAAAAAEFMRQANVIEKALLDPTDGDAKPLMLDIRRDGITLTFANGLTLTVKAVLNCDAELTVGVSKGEKLLNEMTLDTREHCGSYECPCSSHDSEDEKLPDGRLTPAGDADDDVVSDYVPQPQSDRHTLVLGTTSLPNDYLD